MTTVGYGDISPITAEGRVAAIVLMLLGVGLFSVVTATVTSYLIHDRSSSNEHGVTAELEALSGLLRSGALTEEEFTVAKRKVLGLDP